jgi:hypothetical protein
MTFTINKGKHKAWPPYWLCWWSVLFNPKKVSRTFSFNPSCKYELQGDAQNNHNKLFGISSLFIKKNSIRIGWRYSPDKGKFVISCFTHTNGVMDFFDICECVLFKKYVGTIYKEDDMFIIDIRQLDNWFLLGSFKKEKLKIGSICFLVGVFFGGRLPAPHRITLNLKK